MRQIDSSTLFRIFSPQPAFWLASFNTALARILAEQSAVVCNRVLLGHCRYLVDEAFDDEIVMGRSDTLLK
jgi:hypothetical protein